MSTHLCGHYKTFMMSLFDPTRLRMSLMEIENGKQGTVVGIISAQKMPE